MRMRISFVLLVGLGLLVTAWGEEKAKAPATAVAKAAATAGDIGGAPHCARENAHHGVGRGPDETQHHDEEELIALGGQPEQDGADEPEHER